MVKKRKAVAKKAKDALMSKFITDYQKPSNWKYLREMYRHTDVTRNSGDFRITASIDRVRHVFIYLQRLKNNNMGANPYVYDTFNITGADPAVTNLLTRRLEYRNGVFYPELDYDSESIDCSQSPIFP